MPKQRKLSRIMFAGAAALGAGALVQPALAQQPAPQRVEVTGSSLKMQDGEAALPVQIITRADILRSGAGSTEELFSSIPALSSQGATVNAKGPASPTYGLSSLSLRGLGAERTLVLVNGRRLAAFASGGGTAVNLNAIALAAIERIEVLKDGASAVYGSDAVAGVVNIILARNFEGVEASGSYGSPSAGGGGQNGRASLTGGFGQFERDGYSVVLSASLEKERTLFASDRAYAASGNRPPYYSSAATGQGNIEGAIVGSYPNDRGPGFGDSPGAGYGNPLAASNACGAIKMVSNPAKTANGAPYCAFDSAAFVGLLPQRELANLSGNFAFKLNRSTELFADLLYARSVVTQTSQPSPLRRSFMVADDQFAAKGIAPALILYPSNPVYQNIAVPYLNSQGFGSLVGQPLAITSRVFDFGNRVTRDASSQGRLVLGARGKLANEDYEVALASNTSTLDGTLPSGYFSQTAYAGLISNPASNWNPWAAGGVQTGALAEQLKAAQYTGATLHGVSNSQAFDARLTGELPTLAGVTPRYGIGLQSRHDSYAMTPSAALESGDIGGLGGSVPPVDRGRTIHALFAESNVPLAKTFDVGAALREDRYSDIGAATTFKANARWQPSSALLLRASLGTGFRAPTLSDLWQPQVTGLSEQFNDPATKASDVQVQAVSGGNPDLKPERSRQTSFGVVLSPTNNFSIGADWFQVKVRDMLATPSTQEVVSRFRAGDPAYAGLVVLNSENGIDLVKTILANSGTATVKGVDLFANWRRNIGNGRLDVSLNGTYMNQFDQTSPSGAISHKVGTLVDGNGDPVLGANEGGVILRWKHALSATWSEASWSSTLIQHFYTGYETGRRDDGARNFIASQALYDANVIYRGIRDVTLSVGVRNLFDRQPPIFVPVSNQFQFGYDIGQYDPRGRLIYVTATYRFK